ncbi:MAG: hypothetical protein HY553_14610 [Elusimicrobia bacterium]|nr:hypothetical protein [Elusimicrobiota bacterium]
MDAETRRGVRRLARAAGLICAPLAGPGPELFAEEVEHSATRWELEFLADGFPANLPTPEHCAAPKNRRGFCAWRLDPVNLPDIPSLDRLAVSIGLSVCPAETVVVNRTFRRKHRHARYAFVLLARAHAHVFVLRLFGAEVEALFER